MIMEKLRPPAYPDSNNSDNIINYFSKLTKFMVRQYLRGEPNNYPRYFYKYLSCEMSEERIRHLLIDSDLYLSSCKDFNDPFDTTAKVIKSGSLQDMRKRFSQIVDNNIPNLSKQRKELEISKMMKNFSDNPEAYRKILIESTQAAGIFSVTENARDILMWSHYASQHKGMLLQFEIAGDPENLLHALKMHYSLEYPCFDVSLSFEVQFEDIMLRKSCQWKYENEWRILRIGGAGTYQPFKHKAITSLIFGCRSEAIFQNKVIKILGEREALKHPPVNVYKAEMHASKYALKYFKLAF